MNILAWAKTAALLSVAVFLGFGSYLVWTTVQLEKTLGTQTAVVLKHADSTLTRVDTVVSQTGTAVSGVQQSFAAIQASISSIAVGVNQTLALVNHPCVPGPCGTVADIGKTLNTIRGAVGEVEVAAHHEDQNLASFDVQETKLFTDADSAVGGLVPVEDGLTQVTKSFNDLLASQDTLGTLKNLNGITYSFGQTSADFQNKFHSLLYPPPCTDFKCHLIGAYKFVKEASSLAEPAYWGYSLFKGALP